MKLGRHAVNSIHLARKQRGAVLIVALVILLVLTIIGIAGVQNSTLEERMAGNYRDRFTAFQAAETALRFGEWQVGVATTFVGMAFDGTDGTYEVKTTNTSIDPLLASSYTRQVTNLTLAGVLSPPEYFIEMLPKVPLPKSSLVVGFQSKPKDVQYYRVSGKGQGSSGKAEVILQSVYHR